jgi:hypothetical protein
MAGIHDRRHIQRPAVEQHETQWCFRARLVQQLRSGGEQGDQVRPGRMAHQHDIAAVDASLAEFFST